MNRATSLVLAALLVSSLFAVPVVGSGPSAGDTAAPDRVDASLHTMSLHTGPIADVDGSTNRLQFEKDADQDVYTESGPDIGLSFASVDDRLRIDHAQYTIIDDKFATASNAQRERMVRDAHTQIQERLEELEEREREIVSAHAEGEATDTELIQVLVRNHNEAETLADALDTLVNERTDEVGGYDISHRQTRADEALIELHQSSIRASLDRSSQASNAHQPTEVRVQTIDTVRDGEVYRGYRLSMVDGDMYTIETVRFDHRETDEPNQFEDYSNSETIDYITDLYPWAGEEQGWGSFSDASNEHLYITRMDGDRNQMDVYLDAGSGEVYREVQELSLESLPREDPRTVTEDGLELSITETPAHGPVEVNVTDAESGEPVAATVTVDGDEVGETNEDGTLWYVPPFEDYELTVETETTTIDGFGEDD